uniref:Uncharacterized protein n=1 Tax=Myripristis murdjan TaxID=586833 RepID=A0A667WH44_9TELE
MKFKFCFSFLPVFITCAGSDTEKSELVCEDYSDIYINMIISLMRLSNTCDKDM